MGRQKLENLVMTGKSEKTGDEEDQEKNSSAERPSGIRH